MSHKPSQTMADRDGQFQRCWGCGARRKVARLGPGPWDKDGVASFNIARVGYTTLGNRNIVFETDLANTIRPERTRQELVEDLFKQT